MEISMGFSQTTKSRTRNMTQLYHSWVFILKKSKPAYYRDTCKSVHIARVLTTANIYNQPPHPSTDEWVKKVYLYTMEFDIIIAG